MDVLHARITPESCIAALPTVLVPKESTLLLLNYLLTANMLLTIGFVDAEHSLGPTLEVISGHNPEFFLLHAQLPR